MQTLIHHYLAVTTYLRERQEGATAVEYGLMVALIAAVIIVAVTALGTNLSSKFQFVADKVGAAGGTGS